MLKFPLTVFSREFVFKSSHPIRCLLALGLLMLLSKSPPAWAEIQPTVTNIMTIPHFGGPVSLDVHPEGGQLVVGFRDCRLTFLTDEFKVTEELNIPKCKSLFGARYGTLNNQIVVASPVYVGESVIYDFKSVYRIPTHNAAVTGTMLVNNRILSTSDDGTAKLTEILDLATLKIKQTTLHRSIGVARKIATFPDLGPPVQRLAISYDTGEIIVFPSVEELSSKAVKPLIFQPIPSRVNTIRFTPNGESLVAGYFTGELLKIEIKTGRVIPLGQAEFWLNTIDISPAGYLVTGNDQGIVKIFSTKTDQEVFSQKLSDTSIVAVEFMSPNEILVINSGGQLFKLGF